MSKSLEEAAVVQQFNKTHKHSLEDFLVVHAGVSPRYFIRQVRLMDFDLGLVGGVGGAEPRQTMRISYLCDEVSEAMGKTASGEDIVATVPFDCRVEESSQVHAALVAMARRCAVHRGLSYFQINEVVYPWTSGECGEIVLFVLIQGPVLASVLCYTVLSFFGESLFPSTFTLSWGNFLGGDVLWWKFFGWVAVVTWAIHLLEIFVLVKPYKKWDYYRVPTDFQIEWWVFTLLEGYPAIRRFNTLAKKYEQKYKDM